MYNRTVILLFGLLFLAYGQHCIAQSVAFTKDQFGSNKDGLRDALREIKEGDAEYRADPPRYTQALPHFLAAQQFNPNNAVLNVKIGDCYLSTSNKTAALPYLQKAAQLDATADARTHYLLARALHLSAKWTEAIAEYQKAQPMGTNTRNGDALIVTANDLTRRIQECRNGQQLMTHPTRVFIDNAGPELNSADSDYGPVVSADESTILITSRRAGSTGGKKDPEGNGYFEDIYQSTWTGKTWSPATNLGAPVNTDDHNATVGLAPDGQRMLVYAGSNGGDLLEASLSGSAWARLKQLGPRINMRSHET
ncbi:MAG TPA: tetratricopeptide repeat protein, partial [Hymenobacter sp.]